MPDTLLYLFPEAATYNRIVAKEKILKQAGGSAAIKRLFLEQIEQFRCSHELTAENVNLPSSTRVPKIIVMQVFCKTEKIDNRILETTDKAFGIPVIFEVHWQNKLAYAASYRRRSNSDSTQWVFSEYFQTDWLAADAAASGMPVALSLESLYEQLIRNILPVKSDKPLPELIENLAILRKIEREISILENKLRKEKQFNRRVELNRKLQKLQGEMEKNR